MNKWYKKFFAYLVSIHNFRKYVTCVFKFVIKFVHQYCRTDITLNIITWRHWKKLG